MHESDSYNFQDRNSSSEWVSSTHNGKTIIFDKVVAKNESKSSMLCCSSVEFPQVGDYANDTSE